MMELQIQKLENMFLTMILLGNLPMFMDQDMSVEQLMIKQHLLIIQQDK